MEVVKFGSEDVENLLSQDPSRAETLPFGAILVDREGNILKYNKAESFIAGRQPEAVTGKNFFNDVAPCSKGHQFQAKFQQGVSSGQVNTVFEYVFDYKMEPTKVRVHMKSATVGEGIWIFVKRL